MSLTSTPVGTSGESLIHFVLAVGDVSGKGMPAALFMSLTFASLQTLLTQSLKPSELLSRLDQAITQYTRTTYQNCALCYAEIIIPEQKNKVRVVNLANAGCMLPLIRRVDNTVEWIEVVGLPLGVDLTIRILYDETTAFLEPGDFIILSTDGVIEAMNEKHEMFGFKRFEQAVKTGPSTDAAAMLAHLRAEINTFTHQAELQDDLTLVVIQV
jgi:sigma-B regulation protein RsbU (phosphoserine phosphatase)